jgi:hypothetical protein
MAMARPVSELASLLDQVPLVLVPAVLAALFFIAAELGYAYHRRMGRRGSAEDETQVLQTALLVLALLLGFTFSMALERYDTRRDLVVAEANDIGTAWLRAGFAPAPHGPALQAALLAYARVRQASPLPGDTARLTQAAQRRAIVWERAAAAQARLDGARATSLIAAVNQVLDTGTTREKAVAARVPAEVILLLILFAAVACFLLGYVLEAHGDRHRFASVVLFGLMGLTLMLILDLDRPADGAILVDQSAMRELVIQLETARVPGQ